LIISGRVNYLCALVAMLALSGGGFGCEMMQQRSATARIRPARYVDHADNALNPRSTMLGVGQRVPNFAATSHRGRQIELETLLASGDVVLVFYPRNFGSNSTEQLVALREGWQSFREHDIHVVGINDADLADHRRFAREFGIPFPLISDSTGRIAAAFGSAGDPHPRLTVYAINQQGKIMLAESNQVSPLRILYALQY
jgi:peroxiredoxin Q/BCP